uniref:Retrotransposon gag domain-containing protein n=1 Tax=Ananas comosus var. bracteatus TaxID=296719 RepID=A0A6V7P5D7_ANACO|nr:unnamed protein product [Ananas comosus var. bracteatus]
MVDGGVMVNVMLTSFFKKLGKSEDELKPTDTIMTDFTGSSQQAKGNMTRRSRQLSDIHAEDPAHGVESSATPEANKSKLAEFRKFNPPVYDGYKKDPSRVEAWIQKMEKLFRSLATQEEDRLMLATHYLEEAADNWWVSVLNRRPRHAPPIKWEQFRDMFFDAFFPESVKTSMEKQLCSIKQGTRTVAEYEDEFIRLANCVPHVIRDEKGRIHKFRRGLHPQLLRQIQGLRFNTYDEIVECARNSSKGI